MSNYYPQKNGVILFDIDGTLINNSNKFIPSVHHKLLGLETPKNWKHGKNMGGFTDYEVIKELAEYDKKFNSPAVLLDVFNGLDKQYLNILNQADLNICEGITMELMKNLNCKWEIGVLTGNTRFRAFLKLKKCNILNFINPNFFFTSYYGESRLDLVQRAENILTKIYNYSKVQIFIIGDTLYDIQAAQKVNFKVISVATGKYSFRELNKLNPKMTIRNLNCDLNKFYNLLTFNDPF